MEANRAIDYPAVAPIGDSVAKPNFNFQKRQRELAKEQKRKEKEARKAERRAEQARADAPEAPGTPDAAENQAPEGT